MDIRVDRDSDVPLHEQIAAQLVLLIGTGALRVGARLPSVRALALRLRVHRNTVSRAYHDEVLNKLVEKRTGARLEVSVSEPSTSLDAPDLDALVAATINEAQRRGYSLREFHDRLLSRLLVAPPDHLVVITDDAGMRTLLPRELERLGCRTEACTLAELRSAPQRALGAVIVSPPGHVRAVRAVLAPEHPVVPITYSPAEAQVRTIRELRDPSLIAVVSVSEYFLETARAVLAPAIGRRHSLQSHLVTGRRFDVPRAADVILCDTLTYPVVRSRRTASTVLAYPLIAESCFQKLSAAIDGTGSDTKRRGRVSSRR